MDVETFLVSVAADYGLPVAQRVASVVTDMVDEARRTAELVVLDDGYADAVAASFLVVMLLDAALTDEMKSGADAVVGSIFRHAAEIAAVAATNAARAAPYAT